MKNAQRLCLTLLLALLLAGSLGGCSRAPRTGFALYVDGSRGCKQPPAPVALWDRPGAAAAGGRVVAQVPHGLLLPVLDEETRFAIRFYLVEYEGKKG